MKKGDTIEIIERLGYFKFYGTFEEIDKDGLDIICSQYVAIPLNEESEVYGRGRWSLAGIKSIRVINED